MEYALVDFDRLFEELLSPEAKPAEAATPLAGTPGRAKTAPAPLIHPARVLRRATKLFYSAEYGRCLALFEEVGGAPDDPRGQAFWGASRALARGDVAGGLQTCVEAVRAGRGLPDTYCALGIVLLSTGDRAKARAAFVKGLAVDPRHSQLRARMRSMGVRREPLLPFLERSHPINRLLGRLRALVVAPRSA